MLPDVTRWVGGVLPARLTTKLDIAVRDPNLYRLFELRLQAAGLTSGMYDVFKDGCPCIFCQEVQIFKQLYDY